jgi:leader peptidase (prepilin peptidase)/N-methyltransferase
VTPLLVVAAATVAGVAARAGGRTARGRGLWWLAAGAAVLAAVVATARSPVPVAAAMAGGGLAGAAVVDAVERRIPTAVAHGTTVLSLVLLAAHAVDQGGGAWGEVARAVGWTALLVGLVAALWLAGAMGFGDVRLAAATVTAMVTGAPALATVALVAFPVAGLGALATRARGDRDPDHRAKVPFGPALAVAWLAAVAFT